MRLMLGGLVMAALGACAPAIPDSGARVDSGSGVGFGNYDTYQREKAAREAALAAGALPPPNTVSSKPLDATGGVATTPENAEGARIAAEARAALAAAGSGQGTGQGTVQASPSNPPPAAVNGVGISRENNFDAVDSERSIAQDAARIARNRAQYEVIQPEAIGPRPNDVGPNIVAYALATNHPVGTRLYRRGGIGGAGRHERNCRDYASPDQAQLDFLGKGGPERDRMSLDPDGDGYACGWDPAPYRRARSN